MSSARVSLLAQPAPPAPLELVTPALRLSPCDAEAALAIARIAADPRVGEPFRIARCEPADTPADASYWQHSPDDTANTGRLHLAVRLRQGDVVGTVQFTGQQLSYLLAPAVWRQGLGREMVDAVCRHYPPLLGLTRLRASVLRENIASRRVLESAGFAFGGLETRRWGGMQGIATLLRYDWRGGG